MDGSTGVDGIDDEFDAIVEASWERPGERRRVQRTSDRVARLGDGHDGVPAGSRDASVDDGPLTVLDRMDRADDLAQDWTPPPPRPWTPWPWPVAAAAVVVTLSVLVALLPVLGVAVGRVARSAAAIGFVVGLTVLMGAALRRERPPHDDDGARL